MEDVLKDERFAKIARDPRFRRMPKKERKVKIDKRFKSMFSDKRFKLKYSVDKRGRPIQSTTNENLRRYYELSDDEDTGDDEDQKELITENSDESDETDSVREKDVVKKTLSDENAEVENVKKKEKRKHKKIDSTAEDGLREGDSVDKSMLKNNAEKTKDKKKSEETFTTEKDILTTQKIVKKTGKVEASSHTGIGRGVDFSRGEGNLESSSDDSDSSDEEEDEEKEEEFDHKWGELDSTVVVATELSRRLAVCNMDWDRIKAEDLFVLLHSFKPTEGIIQAVKVYPSEYGLKRMEEERIKGPPELVENPLPDLEEKEEDEEDKDGDIFHREKLRQYQINRLKYYYAVVECDTVDTANKIYEECDGTEYENSATKLDLRFIPDDMTFDHDPKSVCTEMPDTTIYKPATFFTTALCQSKVDLTWDETDPTRTNITMGKFINKDINEDDFQAYLASSSDEEGVDYGDLVEQSGEDGEESENEEQQIEKYRKLVQGLQDSDKSRQRKDMGLEITWEPGLKETTEDIVKKSRETKDPTVWGEYLQKKKEKKKQKRVEKAKKGESAELQLQNKKSKKKDKTPVEDGDNQAFSDDEMPGDFAKKMKSEGAGQKKKKGKKKRSKRDEEETEEQKQQSAELTLLMLDGDDGKEHFNLKDIMEKESSERKKWKKKKKIMEKAVSTDSFNMNVRDPRFVDMYQSHLFNIDPSAPEFKRTKGMEALIQEKFRRRQENKNQPSMAEGVGKPETVESKQKRKQSDSSEIVVKKVRTDHVEKDTGDTDKGRSLSDPSFVPSPALVSLLHACIRDPALASLVHSVRQKTQQHKLNQKK